MKQNKIELENMFDNAQTMHLLEFINYYSNDLPATPVKNKINKMKKTFNNNDLNNDAEKHLRADEMIIEKWQDNIQGETQYNLRVNDDGYFYYNESDRDFDYANAQRLFTSYNHDVVKDKAVQKEGSFTGGEWEVKDTAKEFELWRADNNGGSEKFATVYNLDSEAEANAALISQSKNLYHALQDLIKVAAETTADLIAWDGADPLDDSIDRAKAILNRINQQG
jgi:hypothetical protein